MRRLVLAPHADDEVLGCGGLLAKYPDECEVCVVAAPDGVRSAELKQAHEVLGYRGLTSLAQPDGFLAERPKHLVTLLDAVLHDVRPEELYLPFPSMHQDHVAVYEAGMRAARLSMTEGHWFPPRVLVYDVAVYDVNLYPSDLRWNVFESLSEEQVALKRKACDVYEGECPAGAHPMNGILEMAQAIGQARKVRYAEQYALVRDVR